MARKPCPFCHGSGCVGCNDEGEVDVMDLSQDEDEPKTPTTVRGWLETLPEPLRKRLLTMQPDFGSAKTLLAALGSLSQCQPTEKRIYFVKGVMAYVSQEPIEDVHEVYHEGYNSAKEAYGAMGFVAGLPPVLPEGEWAESPSNPYQVTEIWEVRIEGGQHNRYLLDKSQGEKELVDIGEIAELRDKAAKWDEFQETLKRLKIC